VHQNFDKGAGISFGFRYFYSMKKILCLLLLLVMVTGVAMAQTTTIYIFRHAEKDTSKAGATAMTADPPLSPEGQKRAEKLVEMLKEQKVDQVFSTNYTRTRSTVKPLADHLGLAIEIYDPRNQQALANQLNTYKGKTIVIAGHSNTIAKLANLLGGTSYPDLDDKVYDQYFVVTITDGKAAVETHHY